MKRALSRVSLKTAESAMARIETQPAAAAAVHTINAAASNAAASVLASAAAATGKRKATTADDQGKRKKDTVSPHFAAIPAGEITVKREKMDHDAPLLESGGDNECGNPSEMNGEKGKGKGKGKGNGKGKVSVKSEPTEDVKSEKIEDGSLGKGKGAGKGKGKGNIKEETGALGKGKGKEKLAEVAMPVKTEIARSPRKVQRTKIAPPRALAQKLIYGFQLSNSMKIKSQFFCCRDLMCRSPTRMKLLLQTSPENLPRQPRHRNERSARA
jgi:hypothetical protein